MSKLTLTSSISGIEKDRGREIPYRREFFSDGSTLTYYGRGAHATCADEEEPEGAGFKNSALIRRDSANGTKWTIMMDANAVARGAVAGRLLLGVSVNEEIEKIWSAIQNIRLRPRNFTGMDGETVCAGLQEAILSGDRKYPDLLGKIIKAVHEQEKEKTKMWLVGESVAAAARRISRVPNPPEAMKAFSEARSGEDYEAGNFRKALKESGFGWLIAKR